MLVGSHDEVLGNSNCQMKTVDDDFAVSIAVPELLREKYGTRVTVDQLAIRSDRHGYVRLLPTLLFKSFGYILVLFDEILALFA